MEGRLVMAVLLGICVLAEETVEIHPPSILVEMGESVSIPCRLETANNISWEKRAYNDQRWEPLAEPAKVLTLTAVNGTSIGVYRCRDSFNNTSCEIGLRVFRVPYARLIAIKESKKNIILMVEGILLLSCVVIPGVILLREKSQRSLEERIRLYQEENVYQGLTQDDRSTYEDITRGQQSLYQDVCSYRDGGIELEKP